MVEYEVLMYFKYLKRLVLVYVWFSMLGSLDGWDDGWEMMLSMNNKWVKVQSSELDEKKNNNKNEMNLCHVRAKLMCM